MFDWLKRLFRVDRETVLNLERDVQALRLELAERERSVETLRGDLERERAGEKALIAESVRSQVEKLMSALATPVAQLLTQAHLLEKENRPVAARDVLAVALKFTRILEDHGMKIAGKAGDIDAYDPTRHAPLSSRVGVEPGDKVLIRIPGVLYLGKVVLKASVEKADGA